MTLQPPPPPSVTSIPAGRAGTLPFKAGTTPFHIVKHSDNSPGVDYSLRSLARLWNEGYPIGSKSPVTSPWQVRLNTIKLLELFLAGRSGINVEQVLGAPPPRLSDVGIAIGSTTIKSRKAHIDNDWFGPAGTSWWKPQADGRKFEENIAACMLAFLKQSLGEACSSRRSIHSLGKEEFPNRPTLFDPSGDLEILKEAYALDIDDLYISWWISDKNAPGHLVDVDCDFTENTLTIRTPDIH